MAAQADHLRALRLSLSRRLFLCFSQVLDAHQYGIVPIERMPIPVLSILDSGKVALFNFQQRCPIAALAEVVTHREIVLRHVGDLRNWIEDRVCEMTRGLENNNVALHINNPIGSASP